MEKVVILSIFTIFILAGCSQKDDLFSGTRTENYSAKYVEAENPAQAAYRGKWSVERSGYDPGYGSYTAQGSGNYDEGWTEHRTYDDGQQIDIERNPNGSRKGESLFGR